MIGEDQHRRIGTAMSGLVNPHAGQRAQDAMIDVRNGPLPAQVESDAEQLQRQQQQRQDDERQDDQYEADHGVVVNQNVRAGAMGGWVATRYETGTRTKKCGPGQARQLTGTAGRM